MKGFEGIVIGVSCFLLMIALTAFAFGPSRELVKKEDFDFALSILRKDLNAQSQNEVNVLGSFLKRIKRVEKKNKVFVPTKDKIMAEGSLQ